MSEGWVVAACHPITGEVLDITEVFEREETAYAHRDVIIMKMQALLGDDPITPIEVKPYPLQEEE